MRVTGVSELQLKHITNCRNSLDFTELAGDGFRLNYEAKTFRVVLPQVIEDRLQDDCGKCVPR